jgi:hypothetical protein
LTAGVDLGQQELVLETTIPENSFFAIGFGYTMLETDMVVWQAYPTDMSDMENPV